MTQLLDLKKKKISLIGKVTEWSTHSLYGGGSYYVFVVVKEKPLRSVCIYASDDNHTVGKEYGVDLLEEILDKDFAWAQYGDELSKVALKYPEIKRK